MFSLSTLHTLHRTWRSARAGVKAWEAVWRLEIPNPSQLEAMKISRKRTVCERVNSFFGNKLRIYTRVKERNNETFTDTVKQIPWHLHSLNHILTPESCTDAASRSHTAVGYTAPWLCMNKSRTIFHYSAIRKNKSRTCETKLKAWKK